MRRALLYLFVFASIITDAQEISVRTWFDTSNIFIGDQVFYNIEVNQPDDIVLTTIFPHDTLVKLIQVISSFGPDTINYSNRRLTISSKHLITSFDTGSYVIPPFFVEYIEEGKSIRYYSDYAHLDVIRTNITPADSTEIFDIVGPYGERVTFTEVLPWILLLLFISVIVWFIVKKLRSMKNSNQDDPVNKIPDEPIHIVILRDLDKLERMQLWQKGEIKEFYSRLTEILRHFLELKYSIPSLEMTTSETLESMLASGIRRDNNFDLFSNILTTADMSKFAKYSPGADINGSMIDKSKEFVTVSCHAITTDDHNESTNQGEEVSHE